MTSTDHDIATRYQSPAAIRDETFQRRMLGIDADQVYAYLDGLAEQVRATERELGESRDENERLRARLAAVQAQLDEYEQVGERVNEQVVQLFSQAQLVAEEMVEDVSRDARERLGQARAHEQQIVSKAVDTAGEQVRSYARSARAQMESVMESFASEVDRLGSPSSSQRPSAEPTPAYDPLVDDLADWRTGSLAEGDQGSAGRA